MKADQTRVEAVAGPLYDHLRDQVDNETARAVAMEIAQRQVKANDAWLEAHGWKAMPRDHTWPMTKAGHHVANTDRAIIAGANLGAIYAAYFDAAPSPEETER